MIKSSQSVQDILNIYPEYRSFLFNRGYIISNEPFTNNDEFPLYGNFILSELRGYYFAVHKNQHFYYFEDNKMAVFLIGNCVNPFSKVLDEETIIQNLINKGDVNSSSWFDYINELTGDFLLGYIFNDKLFFLTDPAGMLFCAYGTINGRLFLSSHAQLVCDIVPLHKSEYIKQLEKYKYFYKYGVFFPGDLTQFVELKRALQNHIMSYDGMSFSYKRFFPTQELKECVSDFEYQEIISKTMEILSSTMSLISDKYQNSAISMTGGMDSKTTLAAAVDKYDKFFLYSYITMFGDERDAVAAHEIAKHIGVNHSIINISENDSDFKNINIVREILQHNNGNYKLNDNDVRKRAFFAENHLFDIEVKSWVSEIARSNYYKKFGLKKMPKHLSARNMTSMYKIFLWQRHLANKTNKVFARFIKKTGFHNLPNGYDESDMYLWEFRYSAWGGMVITSEHSYSNEIFIPFNNRKLLEIMLRAPKKKRINDQFHHDLISFGNKKISETGITITNWNETKKRMKIERLYFLLNSILPF